MTDFLCKNSRWLAIGYFASKVNFFNSIQTAVGMRLTVTLRSLNDYNIFQYSCKFMQMLQNFVTYPNFNLATILFWLVVVFYFIMYVFNILSFFVLLISSFPTFFVIYFVSDIILSLWWSIFHNFWVNFNSFLDILRNQKNPSWRIKDGGRSKSWRASRVIQTS